MKRTIVDMMRREAKVERELKVLRDYYKFFGLKKAHKLVNYVVKEFIDNCEECESFDDMEKYLNGENCKFAREVDFWCDFSAEEKYLHDELCRKLVEYYNTYYNVAEPVKPAMVSFDDEPVDDDDEIVTGCSDELVSIW